MNALQRRVAEIELVTGQLFIVMLAIGITLVGGITCLQVGLYEQRDVPRKTAALLTAGWFVVSAGEWLSLQFYHRSVRRAGSAHPVAVALQQRRLPVVLRPVISFWWAGNALFLLYFAHHTVSQYGRYNTDAVGHAIRISCEFVMLFGAAHVASLFVLLSVTAVVQKERLVRRLWAMRVLFDLAVAFALSRVPLIDFDVYRFSWRVAPV